jgi:hypothetical protein
VSEQLRHQDLDHAPFSAEVLACPTRPTRNGDGGMADPERLQSSGNRSRPCEPRRRRQLANRIRSNEGACGGRARIVAVVKRRWAEDRLRNPGYDATPGPRPQHKPGHSNQDDQFPLVLLRCQDARDLTGRNRKLGLLLPGGRELRWRTELDERARTRINQALVGTSSLRRFSTRRWISSLIGRTASTPLPAGSSSTQSS